MATLTKRLDTHFAACAAAAAGAAVLGGAERAQAAIIYSGVQNIPIPDTYEGVYLNLVTHATGVSGAATPGWDINPYYAFDGMYMTGTPTPDPVGTGGAISKLPPGTMIDGSSSYVTGAFPSTVNWAASETAIMGIRFAEATVNGGATIYGWVRLTKGDGTGGAGVIVDWAYENTGAAIAAGAVPAPGALALLAVGVLVGRRGRRRN